MSTQYETVDQVNTTRLATAMERAFGIDRIRKEKEISDMATDEIDWEQVATMETTTDNTSTTLYINYSERSDLLVGGGLKDNEELRTRFKQEYHATWHTRLDPHRDGSGNKVKGWIVPKEHRGKLPELFANLQTRVCAKGLLKVRRQVLIRYQRELKKCERERTRLDRLFQLEMKLGDLQRARGQVVTPSTRHRLLGRLAGHMDSMIFRIDYLKGPDKCEQCPSQELVWSCSECATARCKDCIPDSGCCDSCIGIYCILCEKDYGHDQFHKPWKVCNRCENKCGECTRDLVEKEVCKNCGLSFDTACYSKHVAQGKGCTRYRRPPRDAGGPKKTKTRRAKPLVEPLVVVTGADGDTRVLTSDPSPKTEGEICDAIRFHAGTHGFMCECEEVTKLREELNKVRANP